MNLQGKKNKILWADDDPDDLALVREIFYEYSYDANLEIEEVHNGKQVLDYLYCIRSQAELPSLIILDINMPLVDGKQVLATIKNAPALRAIPVIVFTTSNSSIDKLFCKKYQVDMITKPSYYHSLEKEVRYILSCCR